MQLVSAHNGQLYTLKQADPSCAQALGKSFTTGLSTLDDVLPGSAFARGAVHEILFNPAHGFPAFFALLLARAALRGTGFQPVLGTQSQNNICKRDSFLSADRQHGLKNHATAGAIVWCDPANALYPPAVAAAGVPLQQLFLLRPKTPADEIWAITECLRCRGVSATIAAPPRLSRVQARRLQLAAEKGGGIGLVMRHLGAAATHYAAATRWLISPYPGERTVQRWKVQLIHGHGGQVGTTILLERSRDNEFQVQRQTDPLRATAQLAHRLSAPPVSATG